MERSGRSPTGTGHVPTFLQAAAGSRRSAGGSASETNSPPCTRSSVCVEQKVRSSASARAPPVKGVVLQMVAETRSTPSATSAALM